jgi:hypothetical protein
MNSDAFFAFSAMHVLFRQVDLERALCCTAVDHDALLKCALHRRRNRSGACLEGD